MLTIMACSEQEPLIFGMGLHHKGVVGVPHQHVAQLTGFAAPYPDLMVTAACDHEAVI